MRKGYIESKQEDQNFLILDSYILHSLLHDHHEIQENQSIENVKEDYWEELGMPFDILYNELS